MTFTYVSCFSGIGGFETALNRLGGVCEQASDVNKFVQRAYRILYPDVDLHGDITKIDTCGVPDHDLLVGGFPCQAFSVAGKRLGFEDTRGALFFEAARIARDKQPKVCLFENVKGLISHDKGRTLNVIISTLCSIGYTVDFNVLNSKYFGVPQNRERVFIVAVRDDLIEPDPWTIEGHNVVAKGKRRIAKLDGIKTFNFNWPEQTKVTTLLSDVLESEVNEKYYLSDERIEKIVGSLKERPCTQGMPAQFATGDNLSYCIAATYAKGLAPSAIGKHRHAHIVLPVSDVGRVKKCQNGRRFKENGEPMFTLTGQDRHGVAVIQRPRGTNKGGLHDIAPTVTGRGYHENNFLRDGIQIRKLTPLECFRLQGFPDEYYTKLHEAGISDSQLYKMAGNAVTVNVVKAIGVRLVDYLHPRRDQVGVSSSSA